MRQVGLWRDQATLIEYETIRRYSDRMARTDTFGAGCEDKITEIRRGQSSPYWTMFFLATIFVLSAFAPFPSLVLFGKNALLILRP